MAFYSTSARAFTSILRRSTVTTSAAFRTTCSSVVSTSPRQSTTRAMSSAVATSMDNPLLQQDDLPKFKSIDPKYLTPAVETLLEKMEADFVTLEEKLASSSGAVDYESVLPEVERIQFPIGFCWGTAGHLNGVKNGEELRKTYEENQPKIVKAMSKFRQSKPLYDALLAVEKQSADSGEQKTDDSFEMQQRRRAVENSLRSMKLGGVGLEGDAKERFNEIKMRLASLSNKFSNNVLDETKAFAMTVDDPSKMEGVPDSAKSLWANAHTVYAESQAAEGEEVPPMDAQKGPYRITLDMPSYIAVMSHMQDRAIREEIYKVYLTRASEKSADAEKNNVPLIYEIIQLKTEMAKASVTLVFVGSLNLTYYYSHCWRVNSFIHSIAF
jgi:oligopeptidase A